jgi:hypothetical protein
LIPDRREHCALALPSIAVPLRYLCLRGDHADHPGAGLGPGRVWKSVTGPESVRA